MCVSWDQLVGLCCVCLGPARWVVLCVRELGPARWVVQHVRELGSARWVVLRVRELGSARWVVLRVRELGSARWVVLCVRELGSARWDQTQALSAFLWCPRPTAPVTVTACTGEDSRALWEFFVRLTGFLTGRDGCCLIGAPLPVTLSWVQRERERDITEGDRESERETLRESEKAADERLYHGPCSGSMSTLRDAEGKCREREREREIVLVYWLTNNVLIKRPTTGLLMYTLATRFCEEIHLYGFWPFPRDPHGNSVKYHYYDTLTYEYTSRASPHTMPLEFRTLKGLHSQGALRLHTGACATAA
ncbi:hypothetical protein JZ751_015837 [Albula glossodonta]|uniref:Uncharacterized protein n=1 Tax=Albula glossodonta TaxID=121402 RepID=A0A8T2MUU2_9TELE|nr:hypothetical protein JZ751_015837 [Albula glossodonta]